MQFPSAYTILLTLVSSHVASVSAQTNVNDYTIMCEDHGSHIPALNNGVKVSEQSCPGSKHVFTCMSAPFQGNAQYNIGRQGCEIIRDDEGNQIAPVPLEGDFPGKIHCCN
ncbi:hypothetical protein HYFRA_00011674 [Hymenoscyphus fraxineus]|uniref:Cyanovirin-N domain-containing protein n=1 Tax=Hymenoscyphus fraxineus TaxID=746836 RepID=A0A9N9PU28_9HELO|nr:hypothetical protein HYFRA_00011674 [Hymenoscyphus fraxineus]